jgi:hypothetical protein
MVLFITIAVRTSNPVVKLDIFFKLDTSITSSNSDRVLVMGGFGRDSSWQRAPEEWSLGSWAF